MTDTPFRIPTLTTAKFDDHGPGFDDMEIVCGLQEPADYILNGDENHDRAGFASVGRTADAKFTGTYRNESVFTAMRDMVNDLHHLADAMGLDWAEVSEQCQYEHEIRFND